MEFAPGERVRVRYGSEGKWKPAVVSAVIWEPAPSKDVYYQVWCGGKENLRYYRADELRRLT